MCCAWLAGAGHGWLTPLFLSMPLLIAYPAATVLAFGKGTHKVVVAAALLSLACLLDFLLFKSATVDEPAYLARVWNAYGWVVVIWFVFWAGWQALTDIVLLRYAQKV